MKVNKKEIIEEKVIQNQGIIQIADVVAEGISRQYAIQYLQKRNYERVAKGVYLTPDAWQDDLYIISLQYKKIVYFYSHDTICSGYQNESRSAFYFHCNYFKMKWGEVKRHFLTGM